MRLLNPFGSIRAPRYTLSLLLVFLVPGIVILATLLVNRVHKNLSANITAELGLARLHSNLLALDALEKLSLAEGAASDEAVRSFSRSLDETSQNLTKLQRRPETTRYDQIRTTFGYYEASIHSVFDALSAGKPVEAKAVARDRSDPLLQSLDTLLVLTSHEIEERRAQADFIAQAGSLVVICAATLLAGLLALLGEAARRKTLRLSQNHELLRDLTKAVQQKRFSLHYQPEVSLLDGEIIAVEALIRWERSTGDFLPPAQFIPLAEEVGLIIPIASWVIEEACRQGRDWKCRFPNAMNLKMAVNVSAVQLEDPNFVVSTARAIAEAELAPDDIIIELTESSMMKDTEFFRGKLKELHALGINLALDDFGTGYASFEYLNSYQFDYLKIDQSFITNIDNDERNIALVRAMIEMGQTLGMQVIAEGVETIDQLNRLRGLGCDVMQGYLITAAKPAAEIEEWMSPSILNRIGPAGHTYAKLPSKPPGAGEDQRRGKAA